MLLAINSSWLRWNNISLPRDTSFTPIETLHRKSLLSIDMVGICIAFLLIDCITFFLWHDICRIRV